MKKITIKQFVSYAIQICLMVVTGWWILSSSIVQSLMTSASEKRCSCEESLAHLSPEQQAIAADSLVREFLTYENSIFDSLKKETLSPKDYFIYLKTKDNVMANPLLQCTPSLHARNIEMKSWNNPIIDGFMTQVRAGEIPHEDINAARYEIFGDCSADMQKSTISWLSVWKFILRIGDKLWWSYLFFAFIIAMQSINLIWRNPYVDRLFDVRNPKHFAIHLVIWPLRLWLYFAGHITIRQYGDKPLRILSESEEQLIKDYIDGLGRVDLHQVLEQRGLMIQRSLLRALVVWIITCVMIPETTAEPVPLCPYQDCYSQPVHAPPDMSSVVLYDIHSDSLKIIMIHTSTMTIITYELIYSLVQMIKLKYSEYIHYAIRELILKRPWVPPQFVNIL